MKKSDEESVIVRCEHNASNTFSVISNLLVRDTNISINCRWLLIYCLTNNDKFGLVPKFIMKTQKIGKDKLYKIIKEAMEAGYIKREFFFNERNLRRSKYIVAESPIFLKDREEFKKCSLCPDFQDPETQRPENTDTNNNHVKEILHKTNNIEREREDHPLTPQGERARSSTFSKGNVQIQDYSSLELQFGKKQVDDMIDQLNDFSEIDPVKFKRYASHDAVIRSWIKRELKKPKSSTQKKESLSEENRSYAKELALKNPDYVKRGIIHEATDYFELNYQNSVLCLKYSEAGFKDQVENWFRKCSLQLRGVDKCQSDAQNTPKDQRS